MKFRSARRFPILASVVLASLLTPGCRASLEECLLLAQRGDYQEIRGGIVCVGSQLRSRLAAGFELTPAEEEAVTFLREVALDHVDATSRMAAMSALSELEGYDSSNVYVECLDDPDFGVRWEAAKALARRPVDSAASLLAARVHDETSPEVRGSLIHALSAVGGREALRVLLEVFLDGTTRYDHDKLKAFDGVRAISGKEYSFADRIAWNTYYEKEFAEARPASDSDRLRRRPRGGTRRHPVKRWAILAAKISIAAVLIGYLLKSDRLSLDDFSGLWSRSGWIAVSLAIYGLVFCLAAIRWSLLLGAQGLEYRFWPSLKLALIGLFFNSFMPRFHGR